MLTSAAVDLFLDAKRRNLRPASMAYYGYELSRLTRLYPDLPLTPIEVQKALDSVKGAPASRHATFRAFRAFYRWLAKLEVIEKNPMANEKVEAPKVPRQRQRTLDLTEVDRLLEEVQQPATAPTRRSALTPRPCSLRDYTIVTLFLDSAIRSGELRTLCGRDLRDGGIDVRGKSGERHVPLHPDTFVLLRRLERGPDDLIFCTLTGRPLTRRRVYSIVALALRRAGLASGKSGKRGPHLLRHTFGRWWIANEGALPALQVILGHQNVTTTMLYVALAGSEVERQHREHSQLTTRAGHGGLREVV